MKHLFVVCMVFLVAFAALACLPVAAQSICGGFGGIQCPEDEFCKLPDGQCCCDFIGQCLPLPGTCPTDFLPVCGCDEQTYTNECQASAAGVSIAHDGPCLAGGTEVRGVRFETRSQMSWTQPPLALGYNVYLKEMLQGPPDNFGECVYSGLSQPSAPLPGRPDPDELWLIQVTALYENGEGPMGSSGSPSVTPRRPAAPCTCTLPPDVGPCDGVFPRWFHDFQTGQCEMFVWGGCEGNANNFETQAECESACTRTCGLPPDVGPCEALIPRWFFSELTDRCEPFIWGGCGGNANNFETREECQDHCVCDLPFDVGPCDGICPRWFHNSATGQCETFFWGCCDGNANNFETQARCEQACIDVCDLPADVGPCDGVCPRWFHDSATGQCEMFEWGCCDGNANNFETLVQCEAECPPE